MTNRRADPSTIIGQERCGAMFTDILGFVSEFSPFGAARSARCSTEPDGNAGLPTLAWDRRPFGGPAPAPRGRQCARTVVRTAVTGRVSCGSFEGRTRLA